MAALVIKGLYFYFSLSSPFFEPRILDAKYYHEWALRIVGGDFGKDVFYGLPLYPFFLACVYRLSDNSYAAAHLVQACLGLVTLFFIYKSTEKIADKNTALIASILAACYGPLFFHENILIAESIGLPLYAAAFYGVLCFEETPSLKCAVWAGMVLALATLTKAGALLFTVLFVLTGVCRAFFSSRENLKYYLALILFFMMTLAPIPLHNFIRGHDKVFLTSHSGFNFYIGNNPKAEGVFVAPEGSGSNVDAQVQDSRAIAERELGRTLKPSEVSKYWSDKAWAFIRENPAQFLKLSLRKITLFFDYREISDVDDYEFMKKFNPVLNFPWVTFAMVGPLFFVGALAYGRRLKKAPLIALWVASYVVGLIFFFMNARYRLPMIPLFLGVAAFAVTQITADIREKRWLSLGVAILALGVGAWVSRLELVGTDHLISYINAGDAYLDKKEYETAQNFYQEALKINPQHPKANLAMGIVGTRTGHYDDAKDYYLKSIETKPTDQAYNNLGMCYDHDGNLEESERYFKKALELRPQNAQAHNNLGMAYGKQGKNIEAVAEFEEALRLNPTSARAHTNLGLILYRLGQKGEAKRHWQEAVRIDPDFEEAKKALSFF